MGCCHLNCARSRYSIVFWYSPCKKNTHINALNWAIPPVSVVIQDLHVKPSASFCDFVPNISHPNDTHCRS